jgi:type IV pilus assembly protein PilV
MYKHKRPVRPVTHGFTLLEVLIAIVVVAFGLLGLAGLQVFALKNNQSATMRVAATNLTSDIIDRMKSNYLGVINGNYDQPLTNAYQTQVTGCTQAGGCAFGALAQNDLFQWQRRVAAALPGGVGIVCLDSNPNDNSTPAAPDCDGSGTAAYAIKIWWYDDRSRANPTGTRKYMYTAFNP